MALPEGVYRSYSGRAVPTSLAAPIDDSATSIDVIDAGTYPEATGGRYAAIIIDEGQENEEVVWYSDRVGNTLHNCIRGGDGTAAYVHGLGATVAHVPTALDFQEFNEHYANPDPNFNPHAQLVHKNVGQVIPANHEFSGTVTHSGATNFGGAVRVNGSFSIASIDYDDIPAAPNVISAESVPAVGTSNVPMASDAQLGLDLRSILRANRPAGEMMEWAGPNLPNRPHEVGEWEWCDGGVYDPAVHTELFANIGTTYGGTSDAPLRPNKGGRVSVGVDADHALGATGGALTKALVVDEIPPMELAVTDHFHNPAVGYDYATSSPNPENHYLPPVPAGGAPAGNVQVTFTRNEYNDQTLVAQKTTGGASFSIEQPWLATNFVIKVH